MTLVWQEVEIENSVMTQAISFDETFHVTN